MSAPSPYRLLRLLAVAVLVALTVVAPFEDAFANDGTSASSVAESEDSEPVRTKRRLTVRGWMVAAATTAAVASAAASGGSFLQAHHLERQARAHPDGAVEHRIREAIGEANDLFEGDPKEAALYVSSRGIHSTPLAGGGPTVGLPGTAGQAANPAAAQAVLEQLADSLGYPELREAAARVGELDPEVPADQEVLEQVTETLKSLADEHRERLPDRLRGNGRFRAAGAVTGTASMAVSVVALTTFLVNLDKLTRRVERTRRTNANNPQRPGRRARRGARHPQRPRHNRRR